MKIQVTTKLGENSVRLDFKRGQSTPSNMPSYSIKQSKADEFVYKFNKQEDFLKMQTITLSGIFATLGLYCGYLQKSLKSALSKSFVGGILGAGLGCAIASVKKDNLMSEYRVQEVD